MSCTQKQNINFEFFDAITPNLIENISLSLDINLVNNQRLSNGEKGCFLSHVCLWQKMVDENMDYLAVFEDDVYLGENAHLFLNQDDWLKNIDFDIIKLETMNDLVHLSKKRSLKQPTANSQQPTANSQQPTANSQQPTANSQQPTANSEFYQLKSVHTGTCGYIITNQCAKKINNMAEILS